MKSDRLTQQLQFILEIDRLKQILRQTLLTDGSRRENSAEHSWHIAIMAIVLFEYAPPEVDLKRAIQMLLIHDVVEIDAGDTFCYDTQGNHSKADREEQAATRIFGLLPPDQAEEFRQLWNEFESQNTPTAKFAAALDRIQPFLHNQTTQGGTWKQHHITRDQVLQRMQPVAAGTPELWEFFQAAIETCIKRGDLQRV
ncbi:HD domain-containing protein [Egbenema bharatensis]|uniref:HD domain-containing protein n=1 Tax=Egbenema bharatensis TaxID=3463334 RepID=UPI003A83645C